MKPRGVKEVWVSVGLTINLGNYESARIDAGINLPIAQDATPEEVQKRYDEGWSAVQEELEAQSKSLRDSWKK